MKKLIALTLTLILAAVLTVPALADVIWEPIDHFYWDHYDELVTAESYFEAAEDAVIQTSPEDAGEQGVVPAGASVYVFSTWENWGYVESPYGTGWVEISGLRKLFNERDFLALYQEEITDEEGTVSRRDYETICYWAFPGAGEPAGVINDEIFSWTEEDPAYFRVWTDPDGMRWGSMDYYFGVTGWICLDAPDADDLPPLFSPYADENRGPEAPKAETPEETADPEEESAAAVRYAPLAVSLPETGPAYDLLPPNPPSPPKPPAGPGNGILVPCLLVAGVAAAAALVIAAVLKRNRRSN